LKVTTPVIKETSILEMEEPKVEEKKTEESSGGRKIIIDIK
jgi:hypothetical protein